MCFRYCNVTKSCYDPEVKSCNETIDYIKTEIQVNSTTSSTPTPVPEPNTCYNRSTTFASYNNCSQFIYLDGTNPTTLNCKQNFYWNSFKKCCVPSNEVFTASCYQDASPLPNNISCSSPGKMVENAQDCKKFYLCNNSNQIVDQSCQQQELFDWKESKCVNAFNASVVPGCKTTKYYNCLNNLDWKQKLCNFAKFLPSKLQWNLIKYCKLFTCSVLWWI